MVEELLKHKRLVTLLALWLFVGLPLVIVGATIFLGLPAEVSRIVTMYVGGLAVGAPGIAMFAVKTRKAAAPPADVQPPLPPLS